MRNLSDYIISNMFVFEMATLNKKEFSGVFPKNAYSISVCDNGEHNPPHIHISKGKCIFNTSHKSHRKIQF